MNEPSQAQRWDERYDTPDYIFGTEPNQFLSSVVERLPPGRALCLGEGEGRNATFLASRGCDVTAVDASAVGLAKAEALAASRGASLRTIAKDLEDYTIEEEAWDVVVSIFVHLPPTLRRRVHEEIVRGLRPGGAFVLEAFTPDQLELATRAPPHEMLTHVDVLSEELRGLDMEIAREVRRDLREGSRHNGISAVVQLFGFRP
jgi:SAM-dependent methyltransferase